MKLQSASRQAERSERTLILLICPTGVAVARHLAKVLAWVQIPCGTRKTVVGPELPYERKVGIPMGC